MTNILTLTDTACRLTDAWGAPAASMAAIVDGVPESMVADAVANATALGMTASVEQREDPLAWLSDADPVAAFQPIIRALS